MKLKRISLHGVTTFGHPTSIELGDLGRLVALVGPNGAGKTSLLEAVPASLYKRMPSRPGSLYDHCHGRDAYLETAFDDDGDEIVLRVQVDTDQRKAEQYITRDGVPLTTGRSAEHAAVVEDLFGSESLFLSSAFACQTKAGSFLYLPKVERKALLIEMLGLAHLETLAQAARARGGAGEIRLAELRGALQATESKAAELAEARTMLAGAEDDCSLAQLAVTQAETNEAAARVAHQAATVKAESAKALERQHAEALKRLDAARSRTRGARIDYDARKKDLERQRSLKQQQIAGSKEILAKEPEVAAARQKLKDLEDEEVALRLVDLEVADAREALQKAEHAHDRADTAVAAGAKEGSELLRRSELEAPCKVVELWSYEPEGGEPRKLHDLRGTCPLLGDARQARERYDEVGKQHVLNLTAYGEASTALRAAKAEANRCRDKRDTLRAPATIRNDKAQAEAIANRDLDSQRQWLAQAEGELAAIERDQRNLSQDAIDAAHAVELEAFQEFDRLADELVAAAGAVREVQRCTDELHASEKATKNCRETHLAANGVRSGLDGVIDRLEADVNKTGALQQETADTERQVGDWSLLAQALGKDGVQALEIDAAGPEVARICNELLEACYGPRFSLSFETLREKKSKPGEYSESFDVRVIDNGPRGGIRQVENLSGGEKVVIGEAIGLAIAIYNARKSHVTWKTLIRDEPSGLDIPNAIAHMDMLRRAIDVGGFDQALVVSHVPEAWARADTRIRVSGGTAAVEV